MNTPLTKPLLAITITCLLASATLFYADTIRHRDAVLDRYADCIARVAPQGMPLELAWTAYSDECDGPTRPVIIQATTTAYTASEDETDDTPTIMASGKTVYEGAIACPLYLSFGDKVRINGTTYTCEDRMHRRYRTDHYFDILMPSKAQAMEYGRQSVIVEILK